MNEADEEIEEGIREVVEGKERLDQMQEEEDKS